MIRLVNAIALAGWFLFDLTRSSVAVARVVLSARTAPRPRFVVVPLRVRSDASITLVANYITLTPGTLTLDVAPDRGALLVHDLMAGDSGETTRAAIRDEIEPRVLRVTGR